MIHITELDITVVDVDQFNDEATQILEDFTDMVANTEGMMYPADENEHQDLIDAGCTMVYTGTAQDMIIAENNRLIAIGRKYFNENDINISNSRIVEP